MGRPVLVQGYLEQPGRAVWGSVISHFLSLINIEGNILAGIC